MGGRQMRSAANLYKSAIGELRDSLTPNHTVQEPVWLRIVNKVPPSETCVRPIAQQLHKPNRRARKPKNLYLPQQIRYVEDRLRQEFFKDHPWELARPRVIVESDGKDYQYVDWSKGVAQPGIQLSGESVVQRQLWLMRNENKTRYQAYDIARREFYLLRQAEQIESRIALEEARYVGAYFGKSKLEVGMILEDKQFEMWKIWAGKENMKLVERANASTDTFDAESNEDENEGDDGGALDAATDEGIFTEIDPPPGFEAEPISPTSTDAPQ